MEKVELNKRHEDLNSIVQDFIFELSQEVIGGKKDILESVAEMNVLVENVLNKVAEKLSVQFNLPTKDLPFAFFVFGSPSRNLMLPNSDLDIGIVYHPGCPAEISVEVDQILSLLPFDKVDIASWTTIDGMKKENCPSMIEYSKATDAKFVVGSATIEAVFLSEIRGRDAVYDKVSRFVTEFALLHFYDYPAKVRDKGPNLKYDFGSSRDIIFLDWYYLIHASSFDLKSNSPFFMRGLQILEDNKDITIEEKDKITNSIKLILLVKFVLVNLARSSGNTDVLFYNNETISAAFNQAPEAFNALSIESEEVLISSYESAKKIVAKVIDMLFEKLCKKTSSLNKMWEIAKQESVSEEELQKYVLPPSWYSAVPFAIFAKSESTLSFLVDLYGQLDGFEYILRIISQNKNITPKIKKQLLSSKLPNKYKTLLLD